MNYIWVEKLGQVGEARRPAAAIGRAMRHGRYAAEASVEAANIFENNTTNSPVELIKRMHAALRSTRGVVVTVNEVLWGRGVVRHAGVGSISGRIFSGEAVRNMVWHNGTGGMKARKIQEFTYPWPKDGLLVLHFVGLATRWNLDDYPGLRGRNPSFISGVLFRKSGEGGFAQRR